MLAFDLLRLASVARSYTQEVELIHNFRQPRPERETIFYEDLVEFYEPCHDWHLVQSACRRWELLVEAMLSRPSKPCGI